jgi:hypothetical protein
MYKLAFAVLLAGCGTSGVPKPVTCAEPLPADVLAKIVACMETGQTTSTCVEQNAPAEILPYIQCLERTGDKRLAKVKR